MNPKLGAIILVLGLVAVFSFAVGCKVGSALKDKQILALQQGAQEAREKQLANLRLIEQVRQEREATAAALEIERNKEAKIVEKVITRDVIKYVQKPSSQSCALDADGVRIINTAAAGRLPADTEATSTPDASASAAATVASVADNYSTCNTNANQLIALQDWVRALP